MYVVLSLSLALLTTVTCSIIYVVAHAASFINFGLPF